MEKDNTISRRKVIGGLGAGMAAVAVAPVFGAAASDRHKYNIQKLEDPSSKYPKPPFKSQSQPWPGLAGKMEPQPDHARKVIRAAGV